MLDHRCLQIYFCIEHDARTNFTVPNGLECVTKKSYITNPSPTRFNIYPNCPSGFVDVSMCETIYDKT